MGRRGKLVLARIDNENQKKARMKQRTAGFLKVGEITTLCGAEAAAVIYKPDDNQPTVWPSPSAARATISEFLSRSDAERMANSHTAKSFIEEQSRKKKGKSSTACKKFMRGGIYKHLSHQYMREKQGFKILTLKLRKD